MDFNTFVDTIVAYLKNNGNVYFVFYAVAVCLLTQAVKKLLVNKTEVNLLHKFDVAAVLPFIFGIGFAVMHTYLVTKDNSFEWEYLFRWACEGATIGALSTVTFRFVSSLSGESLKSLLCDDVFAIFYNQTVYFGKVKEMLTSGELSWKDFVAELKLVSTNTKTIYTEQTLSDEEKREKLVKLLNGILDDNTVASIIPTLHATLLGYYGKQE